MALHRRDPRPLRFRRLAFTAAAALLGLDSVHAQVPPVPARMYVNSGAPPGGDGSSWGNAFNTLEAALLHQLPGGAIWVKQGTYNAYTGAMFTTGFLITKPLQLYGGFVGTETLLAQRPSSGFANTVLEGGFGITGQCAYHVISILEYKTDPVVIDGFKIHGGSGLAIGSDGGGIWADCPNLKLANLTVDYNRAQNGGGLFFRGGCLYDEGPPEELLGPPRKLEIKNSHFTENLAEIYGGAIYGEYLYGSVVNVDFRLNHSTVGGAAVFLWKMGLANRLDFANCAFFGNLVDGATGTGGGILLSESSPPTTPPDGGNAQLVNCTFARNVCSSGFSGQAATISTNSLCSIYNSIFFSNWPIPPGTFIPPIFGPATVDDTDVYNPSGSIYPGLHNINSDPLFTNMAAGDLTLSSDASLCVDAADWDRRPHDELDVDGDADTTELVPIDCALLNRTINRFQGMAHGGHGTRNYLDMGAYERQSP